MTLTTELIAFYVALVAPQMAALVFIWAKLDTIWRTISQVEKDYVAHDVCRQRRAECPCAHELASVVNRVERLESGKR